MNVLGEERPDSPCIQVCIPTVAGSCVGCGRMLDEVSAWPTMPPEQKRLIWERILSEGYPLYSMKS
jgi:predicted Fe-S protein YdhL (DUF1289 family)